MYDVNKQARSSAEAYQMRQANISIRFAQLLDLLREHAEQAARQPRNWGYAGDLGHMEDMLERAAQAIGAPKD